MADLINQLHDEIDAMEARQPKVEAIVNEAHGDAKRAGARTLDEVRELIAAMAEAVGEDLEPIWDESYLAGVKFGKERRK
jgi:hypothetical protein